MYNKKHMFFFIQVWKKIFCLTQYEIYKSFFENTLFFMGYTPSMRIMSYIESLTLLFASLTCQH